MLFSELNEYVLNNSKPCFDEFVRLNTNSLVIWSNQREDSSSTLFSLWKTRFVLKLQDHGKINLVCQSLGHYFYFSEKNKAKQRFQEKRLEILKDTADFAFTMVQGAVNLEAACHKSNELSIAEQEQAVEKQLDYDKQIDQGEQEVFTSGIDISVDDAMLDLEEWEMVSRDLSKILVNWMYDRCKAVIIANSNLRGHHIYRTHRATGFRKG
ncbi:MAG: hypothetical protein EXX96DRAFT_536644 [Benjaminiella poitrasii]|nr:MAG: hypothetical protein EXX96DRAFT_536644 [Benjaminiella poitrasii]